MANSDKHTKFVRELIKHIQKVLPEDGRVFSFTSGAMKSEGRFVKFGIPGHPDIFVLPGSGRIIYVEAKTGRGKLSPKQLSWKAMCAFQHTPHIVAHCADDEEPTEAAWRTACSVQEAIEYWGE